MFHLNLITNINKQHKLGNGYYETKEAAMSTFGSNVNVQMCAFASKAKFKMPVTALNV